MKPRTKLEKRVVALSEKLKPVTEAQKRWAKKKCFDHNAYMEAGWLWCTECGKYWMDIDAKNGDKIVCPYCQAKLEVKKLEDMEKMKRNIHKFMEHIRPFLGMEIRDSDLVIRPLENISQFYAEGKAMHHCVYKLEYYNRPECLILSARVGGERMETLEVSLKGTSIN